MAGAAVLLLAGHRSDTQAQTFNDAIQGALDGGGGGACNGLKGGPFQGSLNSICASPHPVPEGRARGYTLRDYDVVRRAIYSNPNNGLNAEGSGVNGFVAGLCRRVQEGLQVLSDDLMGHGVLGDARPVDHLVKGHGPHVGARRRPGQG